MRPLSVEHTGAQLGEVSDGVSLPGSNICVSVSVSP
jgi:hypothetical protein